MIRHYCFFNHGFNFQEHVCNDCLDLSMLCPNKGDSAIITIKNVDYCCIIHKISKLEAIDLLSLY